MSDAGLVEEHRVGRETRYRLKPEPLLEVKQWLSFYDRFWHDKMVALKNLTEEETK